MARDVRNVVDVYGADDHVVGSRQVQRIEVTCPSIVLEKCAVRVGNRFTSKRRSIFGLEGLLHQGILSKQSYALKSTSCPDYRRLVNHSSVEYGAVLQA